MVHARQFPDLLDVPGVVLGAVVDPEAIVELGRSSSGYRVEEPVWVLQVLTQRAEELPPPRQHFLGGREDTLPCFVGHGTQRLLGKRRPELRRQAGGPWRWGTAGGGQFPRASVILRAGPVVGPTAGA